MPGEERPGRARSGGCARPRGRQHHGQSPGPDSSAGSGAPRARPALRRARAEQQRRWWISGGGGSAVVVDQQQQQQQVPRAGSGSAGRGRGAAVPRAAGRSARRGGCRGCWSSPGGGHGRHMRGRLPRPRARRAPPGSAQAAWGSGGPAGSAQLGWRHITQRLSHDRGVLRRWNGP